MTLRRVRFIIQINSMIKSMIGLQCIWHVFSQHIQELAVFSGIPEVKVCGFGIMTQHDLHYSKLFILFSESLPFGYALRIHISNVCCCLALFRVRSYNAIVLNVYCIHVHLGAIPFAIRVLKLSSTTT
jgi:hypothetical protein